MASNIMKLAFVINGALNPNFSTSIGRAQTQIKKLEKFIDEARAAQVRQNIEFTNGGKSIAQFDKNIARLEARIKSANDKIGKLNTLQANRFTSRLDYNAAKIDFMSTVQSVKAVTAPMMDAYETAANFERAMSKVGAISLGGVNGEEYGRQLKMLTDTARQLGERTQFTATQSAEAMSYLGMAGWKTNQIIEGMPALLSLAVAGNTDLARTADIVSDNLTAFGLAAKDSTHMADVYATVITNTNTNVEMLGETMKYAAPVAKAFGASMEETAAMAGLMANAGIKASQAGTSLRAGMLRLAGPPKAAATELDKLGISISDVSKEQAEANAMLQSLGVQTGTLEGGEKMASILSQLREKFKGMTENEKVAAGQAIFGRNAVTGWLAMLDSEAGAFEKLVTQLRNCDGAAATMEKRMNSNAQGAATRMKSAYESLQISLMNGFLPTIASMFDGIAKLTGAFSRLVSENPILAKTIVGVSVAIAGVVTALATFGLATAGIRYGIDGWLFWKETVKGCGIVTAAYGKALTLASKAQYAFSVAAKVVSAALASLPIGWVILGIAALIVAGTLLYKHWDKVKTFFTNLWNNPTARLLMFVTGPIGLLIGAVTAIIANWDTLKAYFEYFWDNPEAALFRFQNWVQDSFKNAVETGRKKWDELKAWLDKPIFATFIAPAWDSFKNSAMAAFENVKAKAVSAFDGVKATISGAINSAMETVRNLPETIAGAAGYAAGYLFETLSQMPSRIGAFVTAAGEFIRNLPRYCYEAGTSFITNLAAWGTNAYNTLTNTIGRMVDSVSEVLSNLPEICIQAGTAFLNRLVTWSTEAFGATVAFLINLNTSAMTFLWNLPKICMEAGRSFVSAAEKWAQDAYNSIMEWILRLPDAISNTISNAWEGIKSKFSAGFTVGVSAAQTAAPVAANAKGGIYNRGAFLTTFAERSPEAAIPIDNSERAKGLWMKVGQMLGMVQQPKGRTTTPVFRLPGTSPAQPSGYEPTPMMPDVSGIFGALLKKIRMPKPERMEAKIPDIFMPNYPELPTPIVNTKTVLPEMAPIISPVLNAAAPILRPIFNAIAPAKDESRLKVQEPPVIRNIIQAVADSPIVKTVVNAMAEVPKIFVRPEVNPVFAAAPAVSPIVNVPTAAAPTVNIAPNNIQAVATSPAVTALFDPTVQPAGAPDINFPDIPVQKETLIERIKEFIAPSVQNRQVTAAPSVTINNEFHFSGNVNQQEARETVERAADNSFAKFREMMLQWQREQRRVRYE